MYTDPRRRRLLPVALLLAGPLVALGGCEHPGAMISDLIPFGTVTPPTQPFAQPGQVDVRQSGRVGSPDAAPQPQISVAEPNAVRIAPAGGAGGAGDISLDFADADIREVVAQILGAILRANYTIDPTVHGTATLRTVTPISRAQLIPTLQTLLAQNGAGLVQSGGLYRVLPAAAAAAAGGVAGGPTEGGSTIVALRFALADDLAKVLQPFVANGGRILADSGRNALIVTGDPGTRETLLSLIAAFDIDSLAGQSYALLPVATGDAKDFTTALQDAFRGPGAGGGLAGAVRVVPMARLNAVLVVAANPRLIADVRRVYGLVDRARRQTVRVWHVFYLQNSRSNDIAYVLQQAFTPGNVTAQPTPQSAPQQGRSTRSTGSGGSGSAGIGGALRGGGTGGSGPTGVTQQTVQDPAAASQAPAPTQGQANPLLGGLDTASGGAADTDSMRIIPNTQNNAVLVYGTAQEQDTVEATLRKLDILPLQVRIDATIAEVTLNDTLKYGTQFFFRGGGLAGALGGTNPGSAAATIGSAATGFLFGSSDGGNALSALQAVTTVKVLSSPQLLVLDNESARLQVGNIVPFLTQSSQSTITSGSPVINSIDYRETGVIMEVTPRVNSGGLVTLDISQEVSDVDPTGPATSGINSPTFQERAVRSRVVIQDGQTVGLAGLIRDNDSRGNSGIPWLKDVPILGLLAGQQANTRVRTELLVLITPHVVHDQRDARALTEDLRDQLNNASSVQGQLRYLPPSGSNDPSAKLRQKLRLGP